MFNLTKMQYLDHISDGVLVVDEHFTIIYVNKVLTSWLGTKPESLIGQVLQDAFPELLQKKFYQRFNRLFKLRAPLMISALMHQSFINIPQSNGELMLQDTSVSVLSDKTGLQAIISINNVTEHHKSMLMVKDSAKQIKALAESKMHFLSTISHDIRNPLNGIIGSTDLLLEESMTPTQHQLLLGIKESGGFLLGLIKDFVDLTRITSNQLRITREEVELKSFFLKVIGIFEVDAKAKGLRFVYELDFDYDQTAFIDKARLYQIIENLVYNAIKFTESGSVKLRVTALGQELSIAVIDTGLGIPKEAQETIFDSFSQASQNQNLSIQGFGLGLSIVKSIVELLDGNITFKSTVNQGTTFYVKLPLLTAPEGYHHESENIVAPPDLTGFNILIAEDDKISQHIMRSFLEKMGATVTVAADGLNACNILKSSNFDVILLDDNMPFKTGQEVFTFAKALPQHEDTPFIITSGNALVEDNEHYYNHGFDFILSKPYSYHDVIEVMHKISVTLLPPTVEVEPDVPVSE